MPTYVVNDTPTRIDDGASTSLAVTNTGAYPVLVLPSGRRLGPGESGTVIGWAQTPTTVVSPVRSSTISVTLTPGSPAAGPGPGPLMVQPAGRPVTVTITGATLYADEGLTQPITFPKTITANTSYWPAAAGNILGTATAGGVAIGGTFGARLSGPSPVAWRPGDTSSSDVALGDLGDDVVGWLTDAFAAARPHPAAAGIVSTLQRGRRSVCMQATGDSTGDASDEWLGILGQLLATRYPSYTVTWRAWNDTNQAYDRASTVLTAGLSGDRYYDIRSSAGFRLAGPTITGDSELMARVQPDAWTGTVQAIVGKYDTASNQRGVYLWLSTDGKLNLTWSADGVTPTTATSTAAVPFTTGQAGWVRAQHDVDNGASGNNVVFYTGTDGTNYTQLGGTVTTAGVTSHFANNTDWSIGMRSPTSPVDFFTGRMYEVRVMSGLSAAAYDVMPTLPELYEPLNGVGGTGYTIGGAPVLALLSASVGGQNVTYFDNSTRRPKLYPNMGQRLLFTNTAMNDSGLWTWTVGAFQTWLTNLRALLPGVPLVCLGQNPVSTGALIPTQDHVDVRYARNAALLTWAASGAVSGTWPVDMFPAWPATFDASLYSDGYLHPSAGLAGGSGRMASRLLAGVFGSATA